MASTAPRSVRRDNTPEMLNIQTNFSPARPGQIWSPARAGESLLMMTRNNATFSGHSPLHLSAVGSPSSFNPKSTSSPLLGARAVEKSSFSHIMEPQRLAAPALSSPLAGFNMLPGAVPYLMSPDAAMYSSIYLQRLRSNPMFRDLQTLLAQECLHLQVPASLITASWNTNPAHAPSVLGGPSEIYREHMRLQNKFLRARADPALSLASMQLENTYSTEVGRIEMGRYRDMYSSTNSDQVKSTMESYFDQERLNLVKKVDKELDIIINRNYLSGVVDSRSESRDCETSQNRETSKHHDRQTVHPLENKGRQLHPALGSALDYSVTAHQRKLDTDNNKLKSGAPIISHSVERIIQSEQSSTVSYKPLTSTPIVSGETLFESPVDLSIHGGADSFVGRNCAVPTFAESSSAAGYCAPIRRCLVPGFQSPQDSSITDEDISEQTISDCSSPVEVASPSESDSSEGQDSQQVLGRLGFYAASNTLEVGGFDRAECRSVPRHGFPNQLSETYQTVTPKVTDRLESTSAQFTTPGHVLTNKRKLEDTGSVVSKRQRDETPVLKASRQLTVEASVILTQWYQDHVQYPYPSDEEVHHLAQLGGVTPTQVKKWMANKRVRSFNTLSITGNAHPIKFRNQGRHKDSVSKSGSSEADDNETDISQRSKPAYQALNDSARHVLSQWYDDHMDHPYPTEQEKAELAASTGVSLSQVKSWFANKRSRTNNTKKQVPNYFIKRFPAYTPLVEMVSQRRQEAKKFRKRRRKEVEFYPGGEPAVCGDQMYLY